MREAGDAGRAVVQRAGFCLGERDQLRKVARRKPGIEHEHVRLAADHRDRCEILDRIIGQVAAEADRDCVRARGGDPDRRAVGRGLGDRIGADIAARAGAVLDHDLLAETAGELLPMMRAMMSVLLPAGKGTTMRMGRSGRATSAVWA